MDHFVNHLGSQTNKMASPQEIQDHHRKFDLAKNNFIKKWGHLPEELLHPAVGVVRK